MTTRSMQKKEGCLAIEVKNDCTLLGSMLQQMEPMWCLSAGAPTLELQGRHIPVMSLTDSTIQRETLL